MDAAAASLQRELLARYPELSANARHDAVRRAKLELAARVTSVRTGLVGTRSERDSLVRRTVSEMAGTGPLEPLLADPDVSEIMVNGLSGVFVERRGRLEESEVRFRDVEHLMEIVQRVVAPLGRRLDQSSPFVDARLPDGSRVHAIIPPLALGGPVVTIRKFPRQRLRAVDLTSAGMAPEPVIAFLLHAVRCKLNLVISGGTGTGKTTLLAALSEAIPPGERIVTIEDSAELRLAHPHVVSLETRPVNVEGRGEVTIRHLVRNALRMRPDRIIVGEARGAEAFDLLQAMNTGHEGSLTTVHANHARDALARLESMALMAGEGLPHEVIQRQLDSAVDLVVHLERTDDGKRVIGEVACVCPEGPHRLSTLSRFEASVPDGLSGRLAAKIGREGGRL